ncbi:MAG: RsmD family RNA methyltransferase, partial [Planctomycetota bacterium]
MRIVAGKYRRRSLLPPVGEQTRPITDRAKEQLFENLGGELPDRRVLDAFAGTGTIGLEALSRGAASCP